MWSQLSYANQLQTVALYLPYRHESDIDLHPHYYVFILKQSIKTNTISVLTSILAAYQSIIKRLGTGHARDGVNRRQIVYSTAAEDLMIEEKQWQRTTSEIDTPWWYRMPKSLCVIYPGVLKMKMSRQSFLNFAILGVQIRCFSLDWRSKCSKSAAF